MHMRNANEKKTTYTLRVNNNIPAPVPGSRLKKAFNKNSENVCYERTLKCLCVGDRPTSNRALIALVTC